MLTCSSLEIDAEIAKLMPLMGRITCHVRNQASKVYKELGYDLTPEAADTLMIIHHFDGLPQKHLADILGKDKAAITRLLNTLVRSQLVERIQDLEDRRIIRAYITDEGKAAFQDIKPRLQVISDEMLKGINPQDYEHALTTLSSIIANIPDSCGKDE